MDNKKIPSLQEFIRMLHGKTSLPPIPEQLLKLCTELISLETFYYIYTLIILKTDFFTSVEEAENEDPRENFSHNELAVIAGLLIKYGTATEVRVPSELEVKNSIQKTWEIFGNIHSRMSHDSAFQEWIFYWESWAYDFQYLNFLEEKYGRDEEWIIQNKWFSLETASKIINFLAKKRMQSVQEASWLFPERRMPAFFEALCFSPEDLIAEGLKESEVLGFLNVFSIAPLWWNTNFNNIGEHNEIYSKPILRIEENKYFIPVFSLLYSAVYKEPINWMRTEDEDYYNKFAVTNRGNSAEDMVFRLLRPVIGDWKIFQNIDVYQWKNKITDADILCFIGDKALIVQVKSKTLTHGARKWDIERIQEDYSKAIEFAQEQGVLVKKAILEGGFNFKNKDGSTFTVDARIDDAYVLCVTSDPFPALLLWALLGDREGPEETIVPTSIFDLETVAYYLKDPFEFLFYIMQRYIAGKQLFATSEVAILATHLKMGLYMEEDQFMLIDETCQNNLNLHFLKVNWGIPDDIEIKAPTSAWKNERFTNLLDTLKIMESDGTTDAILMLYSLSSDSRDEIFNLMDQIIDNLKSHPEKKFRSGTLKYWDKIICVIWTKDQDDLGRVMLTTCKVKKYELKGNLVLGLWCCLSSWKKLSAIIYNKKPWKNDPELEEKVKSYNQNTKSIPLEYNKDWKIITPKRKAPCPCWSGKKYKRCHWK